MGAMERLLRKLGYVKLDKYGLYLTPDGRIVSTDGKPVEAADPGGYEVGAAAHDGQGVEAGEGLEDSRR